MASSYFFAICSAPRPMQGAVLRPTGLQQNILLRNARQLLTNQLFICPIGGDIYILYRYKARNALYCQLDHRLAIPCKGKELLGQPAFCSLAKTARLFPQP